MADNGGKGRHWEHDLVCPVELPDKVRYQGRDGKALWFVPVDASHRFWWKGDGTCLGSEFLFMTLAGTYVYSAGGGAQWIELAERPAAERLWRMGFDPVEISPSMIPIDPLSIPGLERSIDEPPVPGEIWAYDRISGCAERVDLREKGVAIHKLHERASLVEVPGRGWVLSVYNFASLNDCYLVLRGENLDCLRLASALRGYPIIFSWIFRYLKSGDEFDTSFFNILSIR